MFAPITFIVIFGSHFLTVLIDDSFLNSQVISERGNLQRFKGI